MCNNSSDVISCDGGNFENWKPLNLQVVGAISGASATPGRSSYSLNQTAQRISHLLTPEVLICPPETQMWGGNRRECDHSGDNVDQTESEEASEQSHTQCPDVPLSYLCY